MIAPPFHRLFNVGALTGDLQKSQPTLKRGAQGERLDGIERCCLSAKNYFTTNLLSSYGTRSTLPSSLKTKRSEKVTHAVTRTYAQADQPTLKRGGAGGNICLHRTLWIKRQELFHSLLLSSNGSRSMLRSSLQTKCSAKVTHTSMRAYAQANGIRVLTDA